MNVSTYLHTYTKVLWGPQVSISNINAVSCPHLFNTIWTNKQTNKQSSFNNIDIYQGSLGSTRSLNYIRTMGGVHRMFGNCYKVLMVKKGWESMYNKIWKNNDLIK